VTRNVSPRALACSSSGTNTSSNITRLVHSQGDCGPQSPSRHPCEQYCASKTAASVVLLCAHGFVCASMCRSERGPQADAVGLHGAGAHTRWRGAGTEGLADQRLATGSAVPRPVHRFPSGAGRRELDIGAAQLAGKLQLTPRSPDPVGVSPVAGRHIHHVRMRLMVA